MNKSYCIKWKPFLLITLIILLSTFGYAQSISITIERTDTSSVTASWKQVEGAKRYEYGVSFYRDTVPSRTFLTRKPEGELTDLSPARNYYFFVRSINSKGSISDWSLDSFYTYYTVSAIPEIACGTGIRTSFAPAPGLYQDQLYCNNTIPGKEDFHKFSPTVSGKYDFVISYVEYGKQASFFYKDAVLGAGPDDWICIGTCGFKGARFQLGNLEAGKTYLFMQKAYVTNGSSFSYTFGIECPSVPPSYDDCGKPIKIPVQEDNYNFKGTHLTTWGATNNGVTEISNDCMITDTNDDDIWFKFTATSSLLQFNFKNVVFTPTLAGLYDLPFFYFNIYKNKCDLNSIVDCGVIFVDTVRPTAPVSYLLDSGRTYFAQVFSRGFINRISFDLGISKPAITEGWLNHCIWTSSYWVEDLKGWLPLLDYDEKLVAQIDPRKETLQLINGRIHINAGELRKDAKGRYYLDRNFTFTPLVQPKRNVSIRLYFSNQELNRLIEQPGSNVSSIDDLVVAINSDPCSSQISDQNIKFVKPYAVGDYDSLHKFIEFQTNVLGSFYLMGGKKPKRIGNIQPEYADDLKTNQKTEIIVSPNPFKNQLYITTDELNAGRYNISITSMIGKLVQSWSVNVESGTNKLSLITGNLSPGLYILKIQKPDGNVIYKKLIRE